MTLHYLSFATDAGFLGAAIVEAQDFISAVSLTHALAINPGGQVFGFEIHRMPDGGYETNRLYSKADMEAIDGAPGVRLGDLPEDHPLRGEGACKMCNGPEAKGEGA